MAKRGTTKWFSEQHEERVARAYGARRSPSSGASIHSKGDAKQAVGTRPELLDQMFECKHTGTFDNPKRSARVTLETLEKLADEAWSESREPVLMLSIYAPESTLADERGFVDLAVRLMSDDVRRENRLGDTG